MFNKKEICIELKNYPADYKFNNTMEFGDFQIPILDNGTSLDYNEFFGNIILKNIPCIVKNISKDWKCVDKWIFNNEINLDYLNQHYGELYAPIANCDEINYFAHTKTNSKVREYLDYLKNGDNKLLYLKDWHLRRQKPDDLFYQVPHIFASDWLNEYAIDMQEDDYMFVYIGPKNSWTPLHCDVYNSFSWSVNIFGTKKWTLFPPGEENKLKNSLGNLPLLFDSKNSNDILYYEVIQEKNDAIFVPSGWHHQVVNLNKTISINHNWVNACNIHSVWETMKLTLQKVEHEIEDIRDSPEFIQQCQLILESLFGMNFESFLNFILKMARKRIRQKNGLTTLIFGKYTLGDKHITFDLNVICNLLKTINNQLGVDPHLQNIENSLKIEILEVINTISETLTNK